MKNIKKIAIILLFIIIVIGLFLIVKDRINKFNRIPANNNVQNNIATDLLSKYCQKADPKVELWECYNLYNYPGGPQQFEKDCQLLGYVFKCDGHCDNGICYHFVSANKKCSDSSDCESGWCKPINNNCKDNCTGNCSTDLPPDICSAPVVFNYQAIEKSKIVNKEAGGALCD